MKTVQPLNKVTGIWLNSQQQVQFRWEPNGRDCRYIHAISISETEQGLQPDRNCRAAVKDLRSAYGNDTFSISVPINLGVNGVSHKRFFLASSETPNINPEELNYLLRLGTDNPHLTSVIAGFAQLQYWIRYKKASSNATAVSFTFKSSVNIAKDVLGYRYMCGSTEITCPLPIQITGGRRKTQTGTLLIPRGSKVSVVPADERFRSNINIKKGSFPGGLL